jgi:hypothetical protein
VKSKKIARHCVFFCSLYCAAIAGRAFAQSGRSGESHFVAIVESRLPTLPANDLRIAISTSLGIPLSTLGEIPIQYVDVLITVSIAANQEIAVLVQDMRSSRRLLSVWPMPVPDNSLSRVADLIAALIRAEVKPESAQSRPSAAPMWLNPYYFGNESNPPEEAEPSQYPPVNPYLERLSDFGNRI